MLQIDQEKRIGATVKQQCRRFIRRAARWFRSTSDAELAYAGYLKFGLLRPPKTQKEKDKTMEDIGAVVTTRGILEQLKIYGIKADPLMPVNDDPMECGHAFRLIAAYCGRWPNESPLGFTREDMGTMVEVNVPEFGDKWVTGMLIGFDWKKTDKGTIFVHVVNVGDDDDAFFSGITVRTRTGIRRNQNEPRVEHPSTQWEQIKYAADDLSISVQAFFATVDVPARVILEDLMRKKLAAYRAVREGK